jgi:hypothetical protein
MKSGSSAPISSAGQSVPTVDAMLVVPDVALRDPRDLLAGALDDEAFHMVIAMQERLVDVVLELGHPAPARCSVGGDDNLRFAVVDAVGKRIGRESGEDDGVDGADPRAGQHGVGGLGDHRQVQDDPVAATDAQLLQDIGEAADLGVQLLVADVLRGFPGVVGLEDDRRLISAFCEMTVDAVRRDVERAILEPADVHVVMGEGRVLDLGIGLDPVEPLSVLAPESLGVADGFGIHARVRRCVHMGIGEQSGG